MYPLGAPGNRRQHDLGSGHRKIRPVVLADAESIDADFIGEDSLVDHVAEDLRVGQRLAAGPDRDIAKGIQSEFEIAVACVLYCSLVS